MVSESDIYPEGCGFESQLRTGIVGGGSDEPVLSSTFKTTAEVRPLSNGTKPPTSPPIWLHTVCVYYCVCALGWVKCRANSEYGSPYLLKLNFHFKCDYTLLFRFLLHKHDTNIFFVVNYSPSCRSKYIRPSFIFRTQIKIFLMKSERFLRNLHRQ